MSYIPDMTERFPEGMRGIDMTDTFFGGSAYGGYEPSYEEEMENEDEPKEIKFEIGQSYRVVGFYGGVTTYIVKEINEDRTEILLAEHWYDVDGEGERKAEWHKLEKDENSRERALEWTSEDFGDIWIYAIE